MFIWREAKKNILQEPQSSSVGSVGLLEPQIEPESAVVARVPVMERAKSAMAPFSLDIDYDATAAELHRLNHEKRTLFGIEAAAGQELDRRIWTLTCELQKARAYDSIPGEKKRLSKEVLTWRKSEPLYLNGLSVPQPEVGLFGLTSPRLSVRHRWSGRGDWEPTLPPGITSQYEDVHHALEVLDNANFGTFYLQASFSGVIPTETKAKIHEASKSGVFSDIRILAEADWAIMQEPVPLYADPIVVGLIDDEMWVIDVFDPTPLETYIASEFTT